MEVEWEDQQKINEFSKLNTRLDANTALEKSLEREKEELEELKLEIELVDEDEKLMYNIGEAFVCLAQPEILERLEKNAEVVDAKLEKQVEEKEKIQERMAELKELLYAKFGRENINLEKD